MTALPIEIPPLLAALSKATRDPDELAHLLAGLEYPDSVIAAALRLTPAAVVRGRARFRRRLAGSRRARVRVAGVLGRRTKGSR